MLGFIQHYYHSAHAATDEMVRGAHHWFRLQGTQLGIPALVQDICLAAFGVLALIFILRGLSGWLRSLILFTVFVFLVLEFGLPGGSL